MIELNPWGFTSILTAIVSCIFAFFLWKNAASNNIVRRFVFLLLVENLAILTSAGGIVLLLDGNISQETESIIGSLHAFSDVLMLILYPQFVAFALPIKGLKFLTTLSARIALYMAGFISFILILLLQYGVIPVSFNPAAPLYLLLVLMFVMIFSISLVGVKTASTKLAREKALAFAWAFGIRDVAWAGVYLAAATGFISIAPMFFTQLYVLATLIYIPLITYGILKVQMLDVEVKLKMTIKNTSLAAMFITLFYIVSEGTSTLVSSRLGDILGIVISALVIYFMAPLHRWADRLSSSLVKDDVTSTEYETFRRLQMYSSAIEEVMAYGEINKGQVALLDRLKESLQLSDEDAMKLEQDNQFSRSIAPT